MSRRNSTTLWKSAIYRFPVSVAALGLLKMKRCQGQGFRQVEGDIKLRQLLIRRDRGIAGIQALRASVLLGQKVAGAPA